MYVYLIVWSAVWEGKGGVGSPWHMDTRGSGITFPFEWDRDAARWYWVLSATLRGAAIPYA